ncbi:unnamed protein product [Adineta steineri]|uniref:CCHC-type domain-containing protein n=1 Tax=Adineta steineri TaxID=433720 RepID=A0A813T336_9BILA|nr:unnamed protein product [Adineta steineri]CAF0846999.1 unnamed protein product [Adineta steineri]CAF0919984.1 unnamed protein product [Adineta steineri]
MEIQAENSLFPDISEVNKNRSFTPNTLHKTLIEIAQQALKSSSSIDLTRLHVLTRFGFQGHLQLHAQDVESYDTLVAVDWPTHLVNQPITVVPPIRVPPHHSIVVRDVPLSWQLPEIKNEIEDSYGNGSVRNIVRMYGRDGNPIPSIRLDTSSSSYIVTFLKNSFINIGHGRHAVKEYHLPTRISPICYNCYEHGHLARHCKNSKRCGRCSQQHEGECSNDIRCVNCNGHHYPGQSNCPVVQHLRAEKQKQQHQPNITFSYAKAAKRLQPSTTTAQPTTSVITPELQTQLISINKKLDEVKESFLDLNIKISNKVSQLEKRLIDAEEQIDVLSSELNYRYAEQGIKNSSTRNIIVNVLLPAFIDISKAIAATSRNQASRNEVETICNEVRIAMQHSDEQKEGRIIQLQQKYPLLQFNNK